MIWSIIGFVLFLVTLSFIVFFETGLFYRLRNLYYLIDGLWCFVKRVYYGCKAIFVPSELRRAYEDGLFEGYFFSSKSIWVFWCSLFFRFLLVVAGICLVGYLLYLLVF